MLVILGGGEFFSYGNIFLLFLKFRFGRFYVVQSFLTLKSKCETEVFLIEQLNKVLSLSTLGHTAKKRRKKLQTAVLLLLHACQSHSK